MYNNSKIIQGLMRLNDVSVEELEDLLKFDLENGITFLDISDIYGNGACEEKLGQVFSRNPELRDKFFIQTKCGIVRLDDGKQTYYDLSYEHIIDSVNNSLNRMKIDSIDCLLLHRPDIFLDAKEVARAFATSKAVIEELLSTLVAIEPEPSATTIVFSILPISLSDFHICSSASS